MNNKLFSLIIIPDSGGEVKSGSFNFKLVLGLFAGLVVTFLLCLFFIVGYHIKLNQEKSYKQALSTHKALLTKIESINSRYSILTSRLEKIQYNDKAFRNFNRMKLIDNDMYLAGIGGHDIVTTDYSPLGDDLAVELESLDYGITTVDKRMSVLESSLSEIRGAVMENREIYNNTPSILPTNSFRITSSYAWRTHPFTNKRHFHAAVDLGGYRGQDIYATADGVITNASYRGNLGRCVKIKHKYGYETIYGHLNKITCKVGDVVKKGDIIGKMGSTGRANGVHLHYAIHLNKKPQNPLDYFK